MGIDCSSREFLKICIIHTWKVLNGKQQKKITPLKRECFSEN